MEPKEEPIPRIGEFNEHLDEDLHWRVDWLGEPFQGGPGKTQPMLDVFLSPLDLDRENPVVTHPSSADSREQHFVKVGVGYLPILYIGAVFKAGAHLYLDAETAYRRRLEVLPEISEFHRLDKEVPGSLKYHLSRIVEAEDFVVGPAWKVAKASNVLAMPDVNRMDDFYVTIPAIEVARFFFCPNSILSRSAFLSGWDDLLYQPRCDVTKLPREITVGLKQMKGLRYLDARHLAFILASSLARETVQQMPQFLQRTNTGKQVNAPFTCRFPFDERTEITAEVIRIPTNTALGERFFVTRLLTCKRPIPFEICYAYPQMHPGQGDNRDYADLIDMSVGGPKAKQEKKQLDAAGRSPLIENFEELMGQGNMSDSGGHPANVDQLARFSAPEERFPDLINVVSTLAPKSVQEYRNAGGKKPIPVKGNGLSTGTPRGANPVVPADIDTNPDDDQSTHPKTQVKSADPYTDLLLNTVPLLFEEGFKAVALSLVHLNRYRTAPLRERTWSNIGYLDLDGNQRYRTRLLAAISIEMPEHPVIVADIERRKQDVGSSIACFVVPKDMDVNTLLGLLAAEVVSRNGWPVSEPSAIGECVFKLAERQILGWAMPHRGVEEVEAYAAKIKTRLEGMS